MALGGLGRADGQERRGILPACRVAARRGAGGASAVEVLSGDGRREA
jgi:hypothetical protein